MPVSTTAYVIRELATLADMEANLALLQHLNPTLQAAAYRTMLEDMIPNGYKQVAVYDGDKVIGLSGYWIITKLYCGKYIEMDNVVVNPAWRSRGIGQLLCNWIKEKAKSSGCKSIHLDVYAHNKHAHRFYFREGFMIEGFHMIQYL